MYTEVCLAGWLEHDVISIDNVLKLFADDQVYVYAGVEIDRATASWDEREDAAATGSALYHILWLKKATPEQIAQVEEGIRRAQDAGRTIESLLPQS